MAGLVATVTLEQVEELAEQLSLEDQTALAEWVQEQVKRQRRENADALIKMLRENAVRGSGPMDSGEEMRLIREERGDQLL